MCYVDLILTRSFHLQGLAQASEGAILEKEMGILDFILGSVVCVFVFSPLKNAYHFGKYSSFLLLKDRLDFKTSQ